MQEFVSLVDLLARLVRGLLISVCHVKSVEHRLNKTQVKKQVYALIHALMEDLKTQAILNATCVKSHVRTVRAY
jgi:hypothetical protein